MKTHTVPSIESLYRPLWLTYGLVPFLAGLDKFFNILADWPTYLSPLVAGALPIATAQFVIAIGVVEMIVGLMILTRWPRLGAWIAAAWLVLIAVNLIALGRFDIAVRDLAMAVGAYTLARLAEARQEGRVAAPAARLGTAQA